MHRLETTLRAKCRTVCHSADMYMLLCSCVSVHGICPQCDIVFVSTCMSRGGQRVTRTQTEDASEVRVAGGGQVRLCSLSGLGRVDAVALALRC